MGTYGDKLKRRDFNVPRRGSVKPEKKRRQRRPSVPERAKPEAKKGTERKEVISEAVDDFSGKGLNEGGINQGGVSGLQFSRSRKGRSTPASRRAAQLKISAPAAAVSAKLHHEVDRNNDGNSGVEAANTVTAVTENTAAVAADHYFGRKLKNSREITEVKESGTGTAGDKLSFSDGDGPGLSDIPDRQGAEVRTGRRASSANTEGIKTSSAEKDAASSNPLSRWRQRQNIKKQYEAAARSETAATEGAEGMATGLRSLSEGLKNMFSNAGAYIAEHAHLFIIIGVVGLLLTAVIGAASSCSMMIGGSGNSVVATSYTAEDEDILGAEDDYRDMEDELREEISSVESDNPGYDEYNYQLDEIGHNPYELATLLTILFEDYRRSEVQEMLETIFKAQYELTYDPKTEIRTREVEKTGTREVLNEETGQIEEEEYTYTDTEEYEYKILNTILVNHQLMKVIREMELPEDKMQRFEIILALKGNRAYLFGDDIYANIDADAEGTPQNPYLDYQVPGEALTDLEFAKMLQVAKRYLDHPYVWGGSTFNEGFDCSGYVCWVINESGAGHVGRTTAEGLRQWTTPIAASERKPGDIVYFEKTYNTPGASHVGIYVGGGMMIHCGNPCKYSNIDSGYFANHMLGYGRIPEE